MKQVRCIETGRVFASAAAAARHAGVSPGAMTHHLKGRQATCGGHTFERCKSPDHKIQRTKRPIRDDAGNHYETYAQLASAKGITRNMAYRHVTSDPERKFRHSALRETTSRLTLGPGWSVNGTSHPTRDAAVRYIRTITRHLSVTLAHRMLDKAHRNGHNVTIRFGLTGWVVDTGDLFSGF